MLYDVSSAAFEGRSCPLGKIGHPRDGVHGRFQIVYVPQVLFDSASRTRFRGRHKSPSTVEYVKCGQAAIPTDHRAGTARDVSGAAPQSPGLSPTALPSS